MTPELVYTRDEAEWLAARRAGVTASEIAVIMGLSPYGSPYRLYHQKLGILPADDDNAAMERGRVLEPYIAEKWQQAHPDLYAGGTGRELFAHPERPWQMATPDRMIYDWRLNPDLVHPVAHGPVLSVLECKVDGGSDEWGDEGSDEIPVHYRCQVLWQCRVMGVRRWHAACLRIRDWRVLTYTGEIDEAAEADLTLMEGEAIAFRERLEAGDPPDVDWRPATTAALKTLHPLPGEADVTVGRQLAISYRAACRRYEQAKRRKDEMTNRLLQAIGDGRRAVEACTELPVATRSVSYPKRVSTPLLRQKYPAIAAECTPEPKPEVKLTPAKIKEKIPSDS